MKNLQGSRAGKRSVSTPSLRETYHDPLSPREREDWIDTYERGFVLYEQGYYKKAIDLFELLLVDKPFEKDVWKALASSRQLAKEYEGALTAWAMYALLCPEDGSPHFHAGECYLSLCNVVEAVKALTRAQGLIQAGHPLKNRLELLLSTLGY